VFGRSRSHAEFLEYNAPRCARIIGRAVRSTFRESIVRISANTVVTLTYKLYSAAGDLIEQTSEAISYLHGRHQGIFPKIEDALADMQAGEVCSISLEPEDAFGEYDADLVRVEAQDRFPENVKVGMQFEETGEEDGQEARVFTVTDVADGRVVVDGNHPLAGQRLRFDCTILDVREATPDELEHGHVHGPGAHH
jgi:FKBP-type peptidyl-prolyl cis-trans isomerase SlyD